MVLKPDHLLRAGRPGKEKNRGVESLLIQEEGVSRQGDSKQLAG